ncbi:UNVERIFIED_CONTAM: hypothetical protein K2H54_030613 [Gekko kuhli]
MIARWNHRCLSSQESERPGNPEDEGEQTVPPTPDELEHEAHFVTTAPTLKLLNHHPLLDDFLHEAKDYLQQIPFVAAGLAGPGPVLPDADLELGPASNMAGPVLSDPTTEPPVVPMTMSTPLAPAGKAGQGRDSVRPPEMAKPALTTDLLTTAMGPRAELGRDAPQTSPPLSEHMHPSFTPALSFPQTGLPNSDSAAVSTASGNSNRPSPATSTVKPKAITPSVVSEENEEMAATTITTTTVITRVPAAGAGPCSWNLTGPEGSLASPLPSGLPYEGNTLECTYTISVYPGYGVEIRVSDQHMGTTEEGAGKDLQQNLDGIRGTKLL